METRHSRFWKQFRMRAKQFDAVLFDHKPGHPWDSYRHVGERPCYFAHYVYHIRGDHADVSLEIHARQGDVDETNRIYQFLVSAKNEIEAAFGDRLSWQARPESDVSLVRYELAIGGLNDEEEWPAIQRQMLEAMVRLMSALQPVVQRTPTATD